MQSAYAPISKIHKFLYLISEVLKPVRSYMHTEVETIKRQTSAAYGCLS